MQTSQEAKLNHSHLCYQDTPKRIAFPSDCKILGLTAHRYGMFAVVSSGNVLRVGRVDMLTGKVSEGGKFPDTQAQHFAKQQSCTLHKLVRVSTCDLTLSSCVLCMYSSRDNQLYIHVRTYVHTMYTIHTYVRI